MPGQGLRTSPSEVPGPAPPGEPGLPGKVIVPVIEEMRSTRRYSDAGRGRAESQKGRGSKEQE
eukprot:747155-Hanusia_phi.AAC.2